MGDDLSDAECADGDVDVNEETFGLDLSAVGPHTAPLPQFFQDQPLYVPKCQFSPPDGWEAAVWNLKEYPTPHAPTGKLWIAKSGLDFFQTRNYQWHYYVEMDPDIWASQPIWVLVIGSEGTNYLKFVSHIFCRFVKALVVLKMGNI